MKAKTGQRRITHPAKMTSREFLFVNGYELAKSGGVNYLREFIIVHDELISVAKYDSLLDLINAVENNTAICNAIVKDLIKLWQDNFELRPASGAILLFIMWSKISDVKSRDFGNLCGEIFLTLEAVDVDKEPDVFEAIIRKIQ